MKTGRLEAFSDGVLAIIITIMVLEMKAPEDVTLEALSHVAPVFLSYLLSFIYIGIYWNNHHHLFQVTQKVNGAVLWANLHLLFWLSLIPFATSWIGENHFEPLPIALYGVTLLMSSIAFRVLQITLIRIHDDHYALKKAASAGRKEISSTLIYIAGILLAFLNIWIAIACFVAVAVLWVIPDKKLERAMNKDQ